MSYTYTYNTNTEFNLFSKIILGVYDGSDFLFHPLDHLAETLCLISFIYHMVSVCIRLL